MAADCAAKLRSLRDAAEIDRIDTKSFCRRPPPTYLRHMASKSNGQATQLFPPSLSAIQLANPEDPRAHRRVGFLDDGRVARARGAEGDAEGGAPQVQLLHLRERPGPRAAGEEGALPAQHRPHLPAGQRRPPHRQVKTTPTFSAISANSCVAVSINSSKQILDWNFEVSSYCLQA